MANPKVTAELINGRFQFTVENWVGIPAMAYEYFVYDLYKAAHVERARLERERKVQEDAQAAQATDVVVPDGTKRTSDTYDDQLMKELENALQN